MPGKYVLNGELIFFLMQKEPATMLDSETFSPFFAADISTLFFSADQEVRACRHAPNSGRGKS